MLESDYELTPVVHTFHKRDIYSTLRIRAFKENITLYLEQNDGYLIGRNTPVFLAWRKAVNEQNQTYAIKYMRYPHVRE